MITIFEAECIAKQHAKEQGEVFPGIYLEVGEGETFSVCYYFDYKVVDKNGNFPDPPALIGGAPGVSVDKYTGAINVISFDDLSTLESE